MSIVSEAKLAPVLRKLEQRCTLTDADRAAFFALPFTARPLSSGAYIVREGEPTRTCCALLSGFAFRHKIVGSGARQILSLHIPGDIVDLQNSLLGSADHGVQMLTTGEVATVPAQAVQDIAFKHGEIGRAMWLETLVDASICREWMANVGRRDARTRISHMLCEFAIRLQAAGLAEGNRYELPMTQEQLADATGLTPVHVNRMLQDLRQTGLISSDRRAVTIENWQALAAAGDFSTAYLHPDLAQGLPL